MTDMEALIGILDAEADPEAGASEPMTPGRLRK